MIRPIAKPDYAIWNEMYSEYIDGNQETRNKLWSWLMDTNNEVNGLIAINDNGSIVGFAHYRPFPVPFIAEFGGMIDDLFVIPEARGKRIAKELIEAVIEIGKKNDWKGIRWITDESNDSAKKAYDKLATRTHWVTYDIAPLFSNDLSHPSSGAVDLRSESTATNNEF